MRKQIFAFSVAALLSIISLSTTSCGGGSDAPTPGPGGTNTDISGLTNDLELDGEDILFDNVNITMWSIVTSPDDVVQDKLIKKFNEEYIGQIKIDVRHIGHFDFYGNLENTWANEREAIPDALFMHNEKTGEYSNAEAQKDYIYPLTDELLTTAKSKLDFSNVYENIDRVTKINGIRHAIPVDAHGFLTYFRQDIIKKNGLGFDNNTRFIPKGRTEYETLLKGLSDKAKDGTLLVRNINEGANHAWKVANKDTFRASFTQSTDPDGLGALYANGGTLMDAEQNKVTFHENKGFEAYLTDQVERWNKGWIGETGTNTAYFGSGELGMFSEGPWWASTTYEKTYNNRELKKENAALGVTKEDAEDPVYSRPMLAAHSDGWWTLPENESLDSANKWYGNGHALSITRNVKSYTKVAAILEFANWYTQGQDSEGNYNLAEWASGGHIPAWKNVYESEGYKKIAKDSVTLTALGDPADIIAMEPLSYEKTVFDGLTSACNSVIAALKGDGGCTVDQAKKILKDTAAGVQEAIDLLKGNF